MQKIFPGYDRQRLIENLERRRVFSKFSFGKLPKTVDKDDAKDDKTKIHPYISPVNSLTSIIILTRNNLEYTKMCLESIRRYTPSLMKSLWWIMARPMEQ